jgi:hypothetical protein
MTLPAKERFTATAIEVEVTAKDDGSIEPFDFKEKQITILGKSMKNDLLPRNSTLISTQYVATDKNGNLYEVCISANEDGKHYLTAIKSIPPK